MRAPYRVAPFRSLRGQFYYWRKWLGMEFHKRFCGSGYMGFAACVCLICGATCEEVEDHAGFRLPKGRNGYVAY